MGLTAEQIATIVDPAIRARFVQSAATAEIQQAQEIRAAQAAQGGLLTKIKPQYIFIAAALGFGAWYFIRRRRRRRAAV